MYLVIRWRISGDRARWDSYDDQNNEKVIYSGVIVPQRMWLLVTNPPTPAVRSGWCSLMLRFRRNSWFGLILQIWLVVLSKWRWVKWISCFFFGVLTATQFGPSRVWIKVWVMFLPRKIMETWSEAWITVEILNNGITTSSA